MSKKIQKKDFTGKIILIGLDAHNTTWHVTIIFEEVKIQKSFKASATELYQYLNRMYPGATFKVVYEAGYCGFTIHDDLTALGMEVFVVNPADVPTTDKENKTKTDKIDSHKLAVSLKNNMVKSIYIPSKNQRNDRSLVRHRRSLVKDQTRIKNRIKAFCAQYGIPIRGHHEEFDSYWSNRFIEWLENYEIGYSSGKATLQSMLRNLRYLRGEILSITQELRALSRTARYAEDYKILISVPGISLITAMTFLTEIGDITRFGTLDKLLSYIGIVPTEHSSGSKQIIGGLNSRHNRYMRPMIIESSWVARRVDPTMASCYNDAMKRMKSQKAIIKVARKLISKIYYIWTHKETYVTGVV